MSLETQLFSALGPLVGNRVYPTSFVQPDGNLPVWPAIRYSITSTPIEDLCGDGDDDTDEADVQLDLVAEDYDSMRALRLAVRAAMRTFPTPARLSFSSDEYDDETRTNRAIMTYAIYGSSDPTVDSPP